MISSILGLFYIPQYGSYRGLVASLSGIKKIISARQPFAEIQRIIAKNWKKTLADS
ncbi:hypothetical protein [Parapedobacter defluvii]|uniref:hypothetical protein n=1 Tax=Parapedobacter defluvii TaxID=2045106 RepID=UPI00333E535A